MKATKGLVRHQLRPLSKEARSSFVARHAGRCGLWIWLSATLLGCPPSPVNPGPDADASPGPPSADCIGACAQLAVLGCEEGASDAGCEYECTKANASRLTRINTSCISASRSSADVRFCGVRCAR